MAALALALVLWTAHSYTLLSVALVIASLALSGASLWSCLKLLGTRSTATLAAIAVPTGWLAEELGVRFGWLFGSYSYTDVLGPRIGAVPIVIPLMWLGLSYVGFVLANLTLWRRPVPVTGGWMSGALAALLAAMLVTAFDLGADPYFVYVLKAWIMTEKDGGWFGETVKGFEGWMLVSFAIVALFQAIAKPRLVTTAQNPGARGAALVPVLVYAGFIVFQVTQGDPMALRVIAFFAMGIPTVIALAAWSQWCAQPDVASQPASTRLAADWTAMAFEADPLADQAIAAIVGPWSDAPGAMAPGMARLGQATRLMSEWSTNGSLDSWRRGSAADDQVVAALRAYIDQGSRLPAWCRKDEVERAEAVFMDYGPLSCVLLFCASLPECYVLPHLSEVLHVAGQLEAHTEYRIRQTAAMVFPVMMKGGLASAGGGGVAQVLKVRLIHATIRHLILHGAPQSLQGRIEPQPVPGGPASLQQALACHGWDAARQGLPCNQQELAYTLLTFGYVFLEGMRKLRLPLTRQEEEATLHAWNVVGHVLGIREELMAHTMEEAAVLFAQLQAMARERPATPDVRPGLGRALMNTMARSIGLPVIRKLPVPLTRWLVGRQTAREIGADQRVGLLTWITFRVTLAAVTVLDAAVRLVLPQFSLTRMFARIVGYHLLTRFLLDQTRPLALPEELLGAMHDTVAGWHHDARAPAWINRLEDRMTAAGAWRTVE